MGEAQETAVKDLSLSQLFPEEDQKDDGAHSLRIGFLYYL
jgi:hypothetical protein